MFHFPRCIQEDRQEFQDVLIVITRRSEHVAYDSKPYIYRTPRSVHDEV